MKISHPPSAMPVSLSPLLVSTKQAAEFFLFAALMGVVILLFTVMAYFYSYITPSSFKEDQMGDVTQLISKPGDETTPLGGEMEELPGDTEGQQGL